MLKSRALRVLLWTALAVLLLGGVAWLGLPPLLKWQLQTRGSALLGRDIRVAEVHFAPTSLALTLKQLSIAAAPGSAASAPQLQVERILLDINARTLLRLAPVMDAVEIDAPQLRLARVSDGHYDIDDLLQRFGTPASPPPPDAKAQRFALFNVRVANGQLSLDDRPVGQQHTVRGITLDLPFLSNLPDDVQIKVEPRLAFALNGSAFDSRGRTTPFAEGRASEFEIRFDGLDLGRWWPYLPRQLPVLPSGGALWADLKLRFEQHPSTGARVELQGQVDVRDMAVKLPDDTPLLAWQSLRVRLANVQPLERRVQLEAVHLDGAVLHVRRDASGALQLLQMAAARGAPAPAPPASTQPASAAASAAASAPASAAASAPAGAGWQLQLPLLEVNAAQVHWHDATLEPAAEASLEALQLRLKQLRWPVEGDAALQAESRLVVGGKPMGQWRAEGAVSDQQAKLALQLKDVDLAAAAPYLRQVLRPQASARLQAAGEVDWARGATPRLALALSSLRVDGFQLSEAAPPVRGRKVAAPGALAEWHSLALADVRADLLQQRLSLGSVSLQRPAIELVRDKAGHLNVAQWLIEAADAPAAPADPGAQAATPWQVELGEFKLDGGRVRFADAALPSGALQLNDVSALVQGLAWPFERGAKAANTQLSARLSAAGAKGSQALVDWRGDVSMQPLGARGQVRVERLPVHVFEPYFGAALPVSLKRAEAGFSGRLDLRQQGADWAGRIEGEALLADVRIEARRADAERSDLSRELLSWNALTLNALKVELDPQRKPSVEIGQLRLSDYFAQLEITEQGRLYLQTLAPDDAAARPPAAAASAGRRAARFANLPVEVLLGGAVFTNGRVEFIDRFIRPNYSAELSDLYGRIGRFDTRAAESATLQFSGVVAGTGVLSIEGEVNPTVEPPALNVQAKATGIELPGLTPYAAKYAGYPIKRGKLSVDVAYKIDSDGKLEASNKIIVNQLSFGEKTESPDATTLPVLLAVSLLQDRYGVIDIDLPLTGSLDDPQFSVGSLILKAIVNLLTKVLTAPFSMLAGSGGDDLSVITFAPGSTRLDASAQQTIDKVAGALVDRPMLKLSVLGMADANAEKAALQRAALQARLQDEQRRERARGSLASGATLDGPLPPLSAEARAGLVKRVYVETALPGKPAGSAGAKADLPVPEMEAALAAAIAVDEASVRQLALERGRVVREALVAKGLGTQRLFLTEPGSKTAAADNAPPKPMAQLTLSPL